MLVLIHPQPPFWPHFRIFFLTLSSLEPVFLANIMLTSLNKGCICKLSLEKASALASLNVNEPRTYKLSIGIVGVNSVFHFRHEIEVRTYRESKIRIQRHKKRYVRVILNRIMRSLSRLSAFLNVIVIVVDIFLDIFFTIHFSLKNEL